MWRCHRIQFHGNRLVKGKTLEEAWEVSNKAVAEALEGLPPIKMHCSVLPEEGIHKAINDLPEKTGTPGMGRETSPFPRSW